MSAPLLIDQPDQKSEPVFAAHCLSPSQRQDLALQVLSRSQSVSELAREQGVSRKFLYHQADKAHKALEEAFDPPQDEAEVLFFLPVTKAWLRQFVVALVLICHASFRGIVELFRDLLDTPICVGTACLPVGTVHNIVSQAVVEARRVNAREDLSAIFIGAHDEIFQSSHPVLVACLRLPAAGRRRQAQAGAGRLPGRPLPYRAGLDPDGHLPGKSRPGSDGFPAQAGAEDGRCQEKGPGANAFQKAGQRPTGRDESH